MLRWLVNGNAWPTLVAGVSRVWDNGSEDKRANKAYLSPLAGVQNHLQFCMGTRGGETSAMAARHHRDIVERAKI